MDLLHSDMAIQRKGYTYDEIDLALAHRELKTLPPEQALLVGQVLHSQGRLATHDAVLAGLQCLRGRLWQAEVAQEPPRFSDTLQTLYEASRAFIYIGMEPSL